jgi:hypothetical protein
MAVITTFPFRKKCELGFASPMTVSSVAPEEIVTIVLRLLVDGTGVFRSSHQYLAALRYLRRDSRDVSTVLKNRKVAIHRNLSFSKYA